MEIKFELLPQQKDEFTEQGVQFQLINNSDKKKKIKIEIKSITTP